MKSIASKKYIDNELDSLRLVYFMIMRVLLDGTASYAQ